MLDVMNDNHADIAEPFRKRAALLDAYSHAVTGRCRLDTIVRADGVAITGVDDLHPAA